MNNSDEIHHVAIPVKEIARAVDWYRSNFKCEILYQDETWGFLQFKNIRIALVLPNQHPPHLCFEREDAATFGTLEPHRDGTESVYIKDSEGNAVEILLKK